MPDSTTGGLLDGITVLDLTTYVTGGFATLMLAGQGADVIKVERPEVGDDSRHSGPPFVPVEGYDGPGISPAEGGDSPPKPTSSSRTTAPARPTASASATTTSASTTTG